MSRVTRALATVVLALSVLLATAGRGAGPTIEDYAEYQPQKKCSPKAKPGTKALARWLVHRGGGHGPIARSCAERRHVGAQGRPGVRLDPGRPQEGDRQVAREFLDDAFATDAEGNEHAHGPPDGDHVHHLERPHVLRVGPVREGALPQLELQDGARTARPRCGTATTCTSR